MSIDEIGAEAEKQYESEMAGADPPSSRRLRGTQQSSSGSVSAATPPGSGSINKDVKPSVKNVKKLSTAERLDIIDRFRHGKVDKYYDCRPNPRQKGNYIVTRRKIPLDDPIIDVQVGEAVSPGATPYGGAPASTRSFLRGTQEEVSKAGNSLGEPVMNEANTMISNKDNNESRSSITPEFFSMQSTFNASLSNQLEKMQEKYKKLSNKLKQYHKESNERKIVKDATKNAAKSAAPKAPPKSAPKDEANDYEYEYEYVDEDDVASNTKEQRKEEPHVEQPLRHVPFIRRRNINIHDY